MFLEILIFSKMFGNFLSTATRKAYSVPLPKALSKNMLYGKVKLLHAHDAMFLIR